MKRRNQVLEMLVCTALAAVAFLVYMATAQDNGKFELEDLEGDRAYLADFSFEGIAGDEFGQIHYIWQEGEWKTKYYAGGLSQVNDLLYQKKLGKSIVSQYFKKWDSVMYSTPDLEAAPSANTKVQIFDKVEDLSTEIRAEIEKNVLDIGPYELTAAVMDSVDVFAEVIDYDRQKSTRYFTGMQMIGKEFYFADVQYNMGSTIMGLNGYAQNLGISSVEMEDAYYTILNAGGDYEGEVYLQRIPKDGMISIQEIPSKRWEELYTDSTYGKVENIKTFSVNADNRIISMEKAGKDRLLLAITENDNLILELYDLEGNLVDRLDAGLPHVSAYEWDMVEMIQREDQLLLWFGLSRRVSVDEDSYTYEVDGTKYYVVEQDTIRELHAKKHTDYIDVQNGKILQMTGFAPQDHLAVQIFGYMNMGFDIYITEEMTGEQLYHGRLMTDFRDDYHKNLVALNIGQQGGQANENQRRIDWERYGDVIGKTRYVGRRLPMEGEYYYAPWTEGYRWNFKDGEYYY